ncbi:MAG TPA: hypothetical protein VH518_05020, partial [Tepidisphaeraceae bacterium]
MTMPPQPPPGQGPVDPRNAFAPPPPPMMMPPMPSMPPPAFYPPPPPPQFGAPRQNSFARAIFMTLATSIFGLSLAFNIYALFAAGIFGGGGDGSRQNVLVKGDPDQKIVVLQISGIIDDATQTR